MHQNSDVQRRQCQKSLSERQHGHPQTDSISLNSSWFHCLSVTELAVHVSVSTRVGCPAESAETACMVHSQSREAGVPQKVDFRSDDGAYCRFSIVSASGIVPQQKKKFAELLFSRIRSSLHTEDDCSHPRFPEVVRNGTA